MMDAQEYVFKLTADIQNFTQNMDTVSRKISLTERQAAVFTHKMSKAMSSASPDVQRLGRAMQSLTNQYNSQINAYKKCISEITKCSDSVNVLCDAYERQQQEIAATQQAIVEATRAYDAALKKQADVKSKVDSGELSPTTDFWNETNQAVSDTKAKLDSLNKTLEKQKSALADTENALNSYNNAAHLNEQNANLTADSIERTRQSMAGMSKSISGATIAGAFKKMSGAASGLASIISDISKSHLKTFGSAIKSVVAKIKNATSGSNLLSNAVKKVSASFSSWSSMLTRRFKRAVISSIFSTVTDGIKSMAKESSSFNYAISSMIGPLKTFSNALVSTFSPIIEVIAPIVSSFVNMLTVAVNNVAQLTARLTGKNSFMKAIPVQYDYAKSLDNTSKSADKVSKSTDKANKAAQEYKRTVLGFDQLHKMDGQDNDTSDWSSSSSGASDLAATEQLYQNTQIDSKVKGIADELAAAFQAHDWNKLGSLMANGVNKAFEWIDNLVKWENCGEKITEIVNGITGTFNSFVKNLDWKLIGKTFGDLVNTIINTVWLFVKGIDWAALGAGLRDGFISFLNTVHWEDLGHTVIAAIQGALTAVNAFFSKDKNGDSVFKGIGRAIRDSLHGAIAELSPTLWGDTAAKLFNGLFGAIKIAFSKPKDFEILGQKIASNINTFFEKFEPEEFSGAINNFLNAMLKLIGGLVGKLNWEDIGKKVGAALAGINWGNAFKLMGVFLLIHAVLHLPGLALKLAGLIISPLTTAVTSGLSALGTKISTLLVGENGSVLSALKAAAPALGVAGLAVADAALIAYDVTSLVEAANEYRAAGDDLSKSIAAQLDALALAYKKGGKDTADEFMKMNFKINSAGMDFKQMQGAIIDDCKKKWEDAPRNLKEGFVQGWNYYFGKDGVGLNHLIDDSMDGIVKAAKKVLGIHSPSTVFEDIGKNCCKGLENGLSGMKTTINNALSGVVDVFTSPFQTAYDRITQIVANIKAQHSTADRVVGMASTVSRVTANGLSMENFIDLTRIGRYADGGIVEDGLFFANHNELVGGFANGRTVVANNKQIITGIEGGVERAVSRAISRYANSGSSDDVVLVVGEEELARATMRGMRSIDKRMNPSIVFA